MAMFNSKHKTFSLMLVCLIVASPKAEAQLGGIDGSIRGTVFCSPNGAPNGASTPVFANAEVQLQCGRQMVSTTTTSSAGNFLFPTNTLQMSLPTLLNDCKVAVMTPLSTCNADLPIVGTLLSSLIMGGSSDSNSLSIIAKDFTPLIN